MAQKDFSGTEAWRMTKNGKDFPVAGIALALDRLGTDDQVEELGLRKYISSAPQQIHETEYVVDVSDPHRIDISSRARLTHTIADGSPLDCFCSLTFEQAHAELWIRELAAQGQILLSVHSDLFLASALYQNHGNLSKFDHERFIEGSFFGFGSLVIRGYGDGVASIHRPLNWQL